MANEQSSKNPTLQKLQDIQNRPLTPSAILVRMISTAILVFVAGFIITTIWAYSTGYPSLPLQGETNVKANGEMSFVPYYPRFSRFVVKPEEGVVPQKSYFDQVGIVGVGTYFYTTINAPHWIFELQVNNLRGMILIPYLVLFAGMYIFFTFVLPQKQFSPESVLNYSIVICLFHSVLVALAVLVGNFISPTYAQFYENYNFYKGQFAGVLLPGATIIILYGLFLGAVVGSVYSLIFYSHPAKELQKSNS